MNHENAEPTKIWLKRFRIFWSGMSSSLLKFIHIMNFWPNRFYVPVEIIYFFFSPHDYACFSTWNFFFLLFYLFFFPFFWLLLKNNLIIIIASRQWWKINAKASHSTASCSECSKKKNQTIDWQERTWKCNTMWWMVWAWHSMARHCKLKS